LPAGVSLFISDQYSILFYYSLPAKKLQASGAPQMSFIGASRPDNEKALILSPPAPFQG
jgi:hypothetical protein